MRIRMHYTCAVAFVLMAAIVATQLPESYSFWQKAAIGIAAAALFLILLIVRELVINLASSRGRGPVKDVTLFPFGGVCHEAEELVLPNHELLMAAARLLSSLVITAMLYGVYALSLDSGNLTIAEVTEWLVLVWLSLFLLHFLPGFPLDAGMALRALLLKRSGDYYRATHAASTVGWIAGLLFIFSGVLVFIVTHQWLLGLVVTAVGWCLWSASATVRRQATLFMSLEPTSVEDVMSGEFTLVDRNLTFGRLFREYILVSGGRYFVVTDGVTLKGVLTERNIKSVPWKRWNSTRIGDIMTLLSEIEAAYPMQSGASALQKMDQMRMEYMPVLDGGRVVGIVDRERLVRLGKTRAEFGV